MAKRWSTSFPPRSTTDSGGTGRVRLGSVDRLRSSIFRFPASRRIVVRCGRRCRTSSERATAHGRRLSAWSGCAPGECGREVAWRATRSVPGPGCIGARAGRTMDRLSSREARSVRASWVLDRSAGSWSRRWWPRLGLNQRPVACEERAMDRPKAREVQDFGTLVAVLSAHKPTRRLRGFASC
jgi:hypothetical protein